MRYNIILKMQLSFTAMDWVFHWLCQWFQFLDQQLGSTSTQIRDTMFDRYIVLLLLSLLTEYISNHFIAILFSFIIL